MSLVIFDCDGVLVDSEPLSCRMLSEAVTEIGLPMTPAEADVTFLGMSWPSVERIVTERLGHAPPEDFYERHLARLMDAFKTDLQPIPGVHAAIDAVEALGHTTCVASSGKHEKMRRSLGVTGLWDRFEGRIFSAWEVARGKPHPDLFLYASSMMKFDPHEAVVVEDSPIGVEAGNRAGMFTVGFAQRTPAASLDHADHVIADMTELAATPGFAPR